MKRKYESPEIGITKFQLVDTITTVSVDNNYYVAAEQKQSWETLYDVWEDEE